MNKKEHAGKTCVFQRVEKLCHSEPVRTLAWESPGFLNFLRIKLTGFPVIWGIATPV